MHLLLLPTKTVYPVILDLGDQKKSSLNFAPPGSPSLSGLVLLTLRAELPPGGLMNLAIDPSRQKAPPSSLVVSTRLKFTLTFFLFPPPLLMDPEQGTERLPRPYKNSASFLKCYLDKSPSPSICERPMRETLALVN